ncbi:hypothetical protein ACGC1H_002470 [Rhizoctonia solani]|uniref:Uncharacterized protein n=1 Tax=Rhizoctonia solani TaxID=456999 RepID=A0A8H3BGP3_9AGAM|nr:unnamed protein product [Rhizoctonia solani]
MSHIWERSEVHKSSKCIELVVTLFSDYCQAATTLANLQKKLSRALRDAATVKGTGMVPANAMQASSALFEALGEVDGKLAKLAEKEYDHLSAEVRKHFKKMAKEEKAHDEMTFNTNVRLKQASSSYDKKVKGKVPYTAEEHAKQVHLLSTLGNEMAAAKLTHETMISQRHVGILFAVGASLSRVADACWTGSCEHVKRAGPLIGRIGQWKSLCEGGWAGPVPEDLPDIDKPGSGVIDRAGRGGSPRKDKYTASLTETMTGSTARSPPLISPFPVTPIPGMGPLNAAAGYFPSMGQNGDLKPPLPPFSRDGAFSSQVTGQSSPGLPSSPAPPPFSAPIPPTTPKRRESQFPPPPQHPASPTRPHVGLPPPSPARSNVGLPNQPIDGLPPSTPVRPFTDLPDSKHSPIRAPPSPSRAPPSPYRPPGSPSRVASSPTRGPLPVPPNPEAPPDLSLPSTQHPTDHSPGTPSPSPKKAGWGTNTWAPIGEGQPQPPPDEPEPEQTVSISRFLNENKEMGIDVAELEGAAIRENVERMAAAAAADGASLTDSQAIETKPLTLGGGNGWGNGSQYELGPTGTLKKLVLDEDRRQISGGPRPLADAGARPLPMPLDPKNPTRKRTGSIESFTSSGTTSRVAAIRSKYDNPPQSPGLRERPPISHAASDMMNTARSPDPQPPNRGWPRSNGPPSSYPERSALTSPSFDNIHGSNAGMSWSAREFNNLREQREREWKAREYALNLEQRELELERQRIMLHQQFQQFTGSSSSSTALSGTTGISSSTSASGTTSTSGTSSATGITNTSGATLSGATTILGHPAFSRRPRSPESISDDTPPPWVTPKSNARYTTHLRDESDTESTSPTGKMGAWMGRGLRRLSMPSPFAEKKPIQVVSIPAPREPGIGNRRSFDAGRQ